MLNALLSIKRPQPAVCVHQQHPISCQRNQTSLNVQHPNKQFVIHIQIYYTIVVIDLCIKTYIYCNPGISNIRFGTVYCCHLPFLLINISNARVSCWQLMSVTYLTRDYDASVDILSIYSELFQIRLLANTQRCLDLWCLRRLRTR